jgi:hypothetical protein
MALLFALGVSIWGSLSFIAVGKYEPLRSGQRAIEGALGALTGYQPVALAVVLLIGFIALGASHAAFWALWVRYPRRVSIASLVLLLYSVALVWLAVGVRRDPMTASQFHLDVVYGAMRWIAASAIVFASVYLFWSGLTERLLSLRYVCGAILVTLIFGVAWVTLLRAAGVQIAGIPTMDVFWKLSPVLLPLMASAVAPWSLSRIRHR